MEASKSLPFSFLLSPYDWNVDVADRVVGDNAG